MLAFHCYDPFLFTHQAAYWVDEMPEDLRVDYPGNAEFYRDKLKELGIDDKDDYSAVGENGFDTKYFEKKFKKFGIGHAAWNYKEMNFGLTDEHMRPVINELIEYL